MNKLWGKAVINLLLCVVLLESQQFKLFAQTQQENVVQEALPLPTNQQAPSNEGEKPVEQQTPQKEKKLADKKANLPFSYGVRADIAVLPSGVFSVFNSNFMQEFPYGISTDLVIRLAIAKRDKKTSHIFLIEWTFPRLLIVPNFDWFGSSSQKTLIRYGIAGGIQWLIPIINTSIYRLLYNISALVGVTYENIEFLTVVPPSTTQVKFITRSTYINVYMLHGLEFRWKELNIFVLLKMGYSINQSNPHIYLGPAIGISYRFL